MKEKEQEADLVVVAKPEPDDPNSLTIHHRKPTSIGGGEEPRNKSEIVLFKHQAWHILYQNRPAELIIPRFQTDYEIFGTDYHKSEFFTEYCQRVANSNHKRIRRQEAWHILYGGMTLSEMIEETNTIYLDPDYEVYLRVVRIFVPGIKRVTEKPKDYAYS